MTYRGAKRKLWIERLLMAPFVWAGKLYGWTRPLKRQHQVFLFFPSGDIGGAPQVNIDITSCVRDQSPLIVFSKRPKNNKFKERYQMNGVELLDLHKLIDFKAYHFVNFFFRGVLAARINRVQDPVVFGGESLFFYKVIPHLRKDVRCIELCHLNTWFPYTIGFIDRIDRRIFSTQKLENDARALYDQNQVPAQLYNRLQFIENAIDIPPFTKMENAVLQVVFVGRGSPQKRVHLVAAIAKELNLKNAPAHFSFVGDVENILHREEFPYCTFYGNVREESRMESLYQQSDVLLLTSSFEGLPVVVMKMMAYGKVVISTAVNAIPDYILQRKTGLLIKATSEKEIIREGVDLIEQLIANPALKEELGAASRAMAQEKFNKADFCLHYRDLLFPKKKVGN